MKVYMLLILFSTLFSTSQKKTQYEQAMQKFKKFYNSSQVDSINAMYGHEWDEMKLSHPLWTNEKAVGYLREFGYLQSFKFIGIDSSEVVKVYVFKTIFSKKGEKMTSFSLDEENKFGTFRFITGLDAKSNLFTREKEKKRARK